MAHRKRISSRIIELAAARAAGLDAIDPAPNMGPQISMDGFKAKILATKEKRDAYNSLLSQADEAKNIFNRLEQELREQTERILAAVGANYGRDSNEYEMVGGTRKSEHRRRTRSNVNVAPTERA